MRKNTLFTLALVLLALVVLVQSSAWGWPGKVVSVPDGDTITVLNSTNEQVRIRLYGIDTPEKAQSYGNKAKQALSGLVFGKMVEVSPVAKDRYGRTVAYILIDGEAVNGRMVKDGWAWVYHQYCKDSICSRWSEWEHEAKSLRAGLWAEDNPYPPWEWRHGSKRKQSTVVAQQADGNYHGNVKSKVFHREGCRHFNCKNCRAVFKSRKEAIEAGYRPCGECSP